MTGCRLTGLNRFLWIVLLLHGIANRLHAQETPGLAAAEPATVRRQTELGKLLSLPEIAGEVSATSELQAPTLDHLLKQLDDYRKAHTPFHLRHREVIKVRNPREAEIILSLGFAKGRVFDTEFESAFWDNRSWKRCLGHGVDGEQANDNHFGRDRAGTPGRDVPLPMLGVFAEPKPAECRLSFDGIYPLITFTGREQQDHFEIWMLPVSGQWIPKRFRLTPKDEDDPIIDWEVKHIKAFGKDRPPQIIDGEVRMTFRDGSQQTTITTEFVITKALYGDRVVPGDIDSSLAPMPAPRAAANAVPARASDVTPVHTSEQPRVIIIETTPDIERSEVIRGVVEALEKEGKAQRGGIERVGKATAFEAILSPVSDMPGEKILKLIETLKSLGIERMSFRVNRTQKESAVLVISPADVTWHRVRTITADLEKLGDFKVEVRVAASREPVTPVAAPLAEPTTSFTTAPGPKLKSNEKNLQRGESSPPQLESIIRVDLSGDPGIDWLFNETPLKREPLPFPFNVDNLSDAGGFPLIDNAGRRINTKTRMECSDAADSFWDRLVGMKVAIHVSQAEFDKAAEGQTITKIVYLPHASKSSEPVLQTWSSLESEAHVDGLKEVRKLGIPVVSFQASPIESTTPGAVEGARETEVLAFHLRHVDARSVARIAEQLFGKRGSIAAEERTNTVFLNGDAAFLKSVQALILTLDKPAPPQNQNANPAAATEKIPALGPSPQAYDANFESLKGYRLRGVAGNDPSVFSFYIGFADQSANELRQQYDALDQQAKSLSQRLSKPLPDPATGEKLKSQLRDAVQQAFEARQKLQRAELAEFAKRLKGIHESIETREKIRQQIIDRRVDELLNPNLKWELPGPQPTQKHQADPLQPVPVHPTYSLSDGPHDPGLGNRAIPVPDDILFWKLFGARFTVVGKDELSESFRGGLKISELRPGGPAAKSGLRVSDIVIGVDRWETLSLLNLNFTWQKTANQQTVRILVQRNSSDKKESFWADLKWDVPDAVTERTSAISHLKPAAVHSATTIKIQALLFDLDEKAEKVDFTKIQHDAPNQLEAMLKVAAAEGLANILSRPQMITRLNQEAMLSFGMEVASSKNGDQVTAFRDVGVKVVITPREEDGKPVLKVAFDFSRIDPEATTNDPDSTPFIQSNSGELTVRMSEYGGKGKLLGPFKAVPGKNRFLHLIVTLSDDSSSPTHPEKNDPARIMPPHPVLSKVQLLTVMADWCRPCREMEPVLQDLERLGYTVRRTDISMQPEIARTYGVDRIPTLILLVENQEVERFIGLTGRQQLQSAMNQALDKLGVPPDAIPALIPDGSRRIATNRPIALEDLQGDWRLIITGQASGKNEGGKTECQVLDVMIRGNRLTASTNPIQAQDNSGKNANSPLRMILHVDGAGDPQSVDLEYVLEASDALELQETIDFYPLRNGKPIALGIIERRGDGYRICIEHSKIVGRPLAFELGETAILWELRPLAAAGSGKVREGADAVPSAQTPDNSPPTNNRRNLPGDQNSPQAVLDAIQRCQEEKNYPGFVALLSDAEAARMAGMMLQSAVSLSLINGLIEKSPNPDANPDYLEVQKIQAIVNRYTVDDPDLKAQDAFHQIAAIGERQMSVQIPGAQKSPVPLPDWNAEQYSLHLRTAARVVSDPRAFVADMMKAMEEFNPAKAEPANVEWKLEVNGDQAIATTVAGSTHVGSLTPAPVHLMKVDGTWRITSLISDENLMKLINVPGSGH